VSSIGFDCGPFHAFVSSHGHFGIAARDLPWAVVGSLPGLLEHGTAEILNETWDSEGLEPDRLIGTDDGIPNLEDPRLARCVRAYVEKNWPSLQRRYEQAKQRWEEMKQHTLVVKGVPLRPGQTVLLYCGSPPTEVTKFIFHAIDDDGCVYLGGKNGFRSQKLGPSDRLEPLDTE